MRILLLTHRYLPDHRAGVETYTGHLARGLMARGHTVRVLTANKVITRATGQVRGYSLDGVEVREVTNNIDAENWAESLTISAMAERFALELADFGPDVVHSQHLMYWGASVPERARCAGVPFVQTLHDYWMICGRMGQLVDWRGQRCEGPSAGNCPDCLSRTFWRQGDKERRWIRRLGQIRRFTGLRLDGLARRLGGKKKSPMTKAPVVAQEDGDWQSHHKARRAAFSAAAAEMHLILTPSRVLAERLVSEGITSTEIRHFLQGIQSEGFKEGSGRLKGAPLRFGFAGTFAPHKGLDTLIEAFAALPNGAATLTLHGPDASGPDYRDSLVSRFGHLTGLTFGPRLDRQGLALFFQELDLLCVPSLWNECCPLTIQEAKIAKLPALVSGIGGMAELIEDGVDGRHAEPGNARDWTAKLTDVVADPKTLDQWREAITEPLAFDDHLEALEVVYAEVISKGAERSTTTPS